MNNQDYAIRGSTQVDVSGVASPSNFLVEDVPVVGFMPACWGQDDLPAYGTFSLQTDISAGPQESPPSVAITMPSTVACPTSVALTATVTGRSTWTQTARAPST